MRAKKKRSTVWAGGHALCCEWIPTKTLAKGTLIFLHEGLGSIGQWHDIPETLGNVCNYNVLVFDRFGHGQSSRLPPPYLRSIEYFQFEAQQTIPNLLDKFKIDEAVLVGHSDGATIAVMAASLGDPRIHSVVAEAGHWFVERQTLASIRSLIKQWLDSDLQKRLAKYHGDNVEGMFMGWTNLWLNPLFPDFFDVRPKLSAVTCPLLAIQGKSDKYGSLQQLEALSGTSGYIEVRALNSCGHWPHNEARETYIRHVKNFLNNTSKR